MSVSQDVVGRTYPPIAPYQVGREKIREFAAAVKATDPAHHDVDAARAAGYADLVAPPTFAVVVSQRADAALVNDPAAGIDFSRVVHADQRFTHHRPIVAGDELTAAVTAAVPIPVIASGGVGTLDHLAAGILAGGADAVLAASIFHYGRYSIAEAKRAMREAGIDVR